MRKSPSASTWIGAVALIAGLAILGLQAGVRFLPWALGLTLVVGAFVAILVTTRSQSRRSDEVALTLGPGPPAVDAVLDFSCLPGDWARKAPDALGPLALRASGMDVTVRVLDDYLQIEKRPTPLTGDHPFTARAPLRAVSNVKVGPPQLSLMGSSLNFLLESGEEIRIEIPAEKASADTVRHAFLEEVRSAGWQPKPDSGGLEITSPVPPALTPQLRSYVLLLACFLPFAIAMLGALQGPFAAVSATITFFSALALVIMRPRWMSRALAWPMAATALAFALDAWLVQQPVRLLGTACSAGLALWMHRASRSF